MRPVPDVAEIGIGSGERKEARIQEPESLLQRGFRDLSKPCRTSFAGAVTIIAFAMLGSHPAAAQMQLPGALGGGAPPAGEHKSGGGGGGSSAAPSSYAPPKPVVIKAPTEDTVTGHPLSRDGVKGEMVLDKSGEGLALSKLTLDGDKISKPGTACTVDVPLAAPLPATPAGRPAGAIRYSVPVPACAFTIDVLDGAVLLTRAEPACEFTAADCRVTPGGVWGPRAIDITPKRAKDLERERVRLETTMRANFHALLRKAGKDRTAVKAIAKDQAAFSSEREMTCRDYAQETVHGFCSTQITQARALALMAQFGTMPEGPHGRRQRPRPAAAAKAPDDADQ